MRALPGRILLAALLLFAVRPACAEALELPYEADLAAKTVTIDLFESRVEVLYDNETAPSVRVTNLLQEGSAGFVLVEDEGGQLTLEQPHGDPETAPRLLVKLHLAPATTLNVKGSKLTISVERFGAARPATDGPERAVPTDPPLVHFGGTDSSLHVIGVPFECSGRGNHVQAENVRGVARAQLQQGDFVIEALAGLLDLRLERGTARFSTVRGTVRATLDGAELRGAGGEGRVEITAGNATFGLDEWTGPIVVNGDDNRVEWHAITSDSQASSVSGRRNEIHVETTKGPLQIDMNGGRCEARDLGGQSQFSVRGAGALDVDNTGGPLRVELAENASARLRELGHESVVRGEQASIELRAAQNVALRLTGGSVVGRELSGRLEFHATDADVDLEITSAASSPELDLSGATRARVVLPQPCYVQLTGERDANAADRVTLSGCEGDTDGRRAYTMRPPGSRPPVLMKAKVSEGSSAEIRAGL